MKTVTTEECARELLEVVPLIMRDIRNQMRSRRAPDLSVPQFRTLTFVDRNSEASLSDVANHLGLALPSTSKLVDALLKKDLITREENSVDRRKVTLVVTNRGLSILETSRKETLVSLSQKLSSTDAKDRTNITEAMQTLRFVFTVPKKQSK